MILSWLLIGGTIASAQDRHPAPLPLAGSRRLLSRPHETTAAGPSGLSPEPTSPPLDRHGAHALMARATTSAAEASVCGYFNGDKNSRLVCGQENWNCVFHASNADFPALAGCCPVSSTAQCKFLTTCYDNAQVGATTSLGSLASDPFVRLCTGSDNPYCHTWTWPDLDMTDNACTYTSDPAVETVRTVGSLTDVTDSQDQITETLAMSWVGDSVLRALAAAGTTAGSTETSATATTARTAVPTDAPEEHGSGTPVGKIVGGVVGGVVGVAVTVVAGIMYRRRKKRVAPPGGDDRAPGGMAGSRYAEIDAKHRSYELESRPMAVELPAQPTRHELE